jgi:HEAT repeat protein
MKSLLLFALALLLAGCSKAKTGVSVPELLETLKEDKDPKMRYWAARQLGSHGAKAEQVVPALSEALKDPDSTVRIGSVYALAEIGPAAKAAIPALEAALKDPNKEVQKGAAYALQKIQNPPR